MTTVEPKPQFQSLSEADILAALQDHDPKNPVAVEVARLITAYTANFQRHVERVGYLPPHLLQMKARWPIEAVAMRLTTETIRGTVTAAKR